MRRAAFVLGLIAFLLVSGAAGVFVWGYAQYVRPGGPETNVVAVIPKGAGIEAIAAQLERLGVIANQLVFRYGARVEGKDKMLRAGEYVFRARSSPREVVDLLMSGETVVRRLTVPEGLTTAQVLLRLEQVEGLAGEIEKWPGEGTLMPETYHFSFGDSRNAIVDRMVKSMQQTVNELWQNRSPGLPYQSVREAITLASIVEKETALPEERARIAAVFVNRMKKGMRLQSDPTVLYGLAGGSAPLDRPLTLNDLKSETPYNTYVIDGLPPGPICNPGRAAIAAVMSPAETEDLYFVADGTGGHAFARTLKEHNKNVAAWRALQQQGRAAPPARPQ